MPQGEKGRADGVFEGGGVKGIAFAGAIAAAEEEAGVEEWVNVAGTSAGAIVAALLALGSDADDLRTALAATDYRRLADFGSCGKLIGGSLNALRLRGLAPGRYFRRWLADRFEEAIGKRDPTFADVVRHDLPPDLRPDERERARYRLRVIASDVTSGRMLVLPDDIVEYEDAEGRALLPDELPLVEAVRMSMSYPFLYDPARLFKDGRPHYVVDGGLLSNFPVWLFDSPRPKRPTWGFRLHAGTGHRRLPYRGIPRPFWELPLAKAMFHSAMEAWDRKHLAAVTAVRTVSIPTGSIRTTQFGLTRREADYLYASGYRQAKEFFRTQRAYLNSFGQSPEGVAAGAARGGS